MFVVDGCRSFFESIVGLATFVGGASLEEYLLPLLVQALTDGEEFVTDQVLKTLTSLTTIGLFQKHIVRDLATVIAPFLCHPNPWLRQGARVFIVHGANAFSIADLWCFLYPTIRPFLRTDLSQITPDNIVKMLKAPLSRTLYDVALAWANKSRTFLDPIRRNLTSMDARPMREFRNRQFEDDDEYTDKLRSLGMTLEDEELLFAMKELLVKVARTQTTREFLTNPQQTTDKIVAKNLGITPNTVFLNPMYEIRLEWKRDDDTMSILSSVASELDIQLLHFADENSHSFQQVGQESAWQLPAIKENLETTSIHLPQHFKKKQDGKSKASLSASAIVAQGTFRASTYLENIHEDDDASQDDKNIVTDLQPLHNEAWIPDDADENLRALLRKMATDAFPDPMIEFGPVLTNSVLNRHRHAVRSHFDSTGAFSWSPKGILTSMLKEDNSSITTIAIAPDHSYFATASQNGTIRLWDSERVAKHVCSKPRLVYTQFSCRITCMTFIENRNVLIVGGENGVIQFLRVVYENHAKKGIRYRGIKCVLEHTLNKAHPVQMIHHLQDLNSYLLVATNTSAIHCIDLVTMDYKWTLRSPGQHGMLTSMIIDPMRSWLLTGSSHGVLSLWDLRFGVLLKSWLHHSRERINRITWYSFPQKKGKFAIVASGRREVSIWDIEAGLCVEVFVLEESKEDGSFHDTYEPINFDDDDLVQLMSAGHYTTSYQQVAFRSLLNPLDSPLIFAAGHGLGIRCWNVMDASLSKTIGQNTTRYTHSEYQVGSVTVHVDTCMDTHSGIELDEAEAKNALKASVTDIQLLEWPHPLLLCARYDGSIDVYV